MLQVNREGNGRDRLAQGPGLQEQESLRKLLTGSASGKRPSPSRPPNKHSGHRTFCSPTPPNMAALGEDLLGVVNKLQDLVFNTIGNDSLDLPQIVRLFTAAAGMAPHRHGSTDTRIGCRGLAIIR